MNEYYFGVIIGAFLGWKFRKYLERERQRKMKFTYDFDALGDKLVSPKPQDGGHSYVIRPVLYGKYEGMDTSEPASFEDFDRYSLYFKVSDGMGGKMEECIGPDFDTVREAIIYAEEYAISR